MEQVGRIIVNHEKLQREASEKGEGSTWTGTLQLTSQIEIGENTLTMETQFARSNWSTPASSILHASRSTLSSPSVCTSGGGSEWLGDHPRLHEGRSLRASSTRVEPPLEVHASDESQLSPTSDCTSDAARKWVENYLRLTGAKVSEEVSEPNSSHLEHSSVGTGGDAPETHKQYTHSASPSLQPSSSGLLSSNVSS